MCLFFHGIVMCLFSSVTLVVKIFLMQFKLWISLLIFTLNFDGDLFHRASYLTLQLLMWSPHSYLAYRGKHLHGCSALTDKCHINMSQITFTTPTKPHILTLSASLKVFFWSLSVLYADSPSHLQKLCRHGRQVYFPTSLWSNKGKGMLYLPSDEINYKTFVASAQNILKHSMSLSRTVQWLCPRESWVQKTKACSTFLPTGHIAGHDCSQFRPPATQSQRSWLFTFTSHPHRTLWSDSR